MYPVQCFRVSFCTTGCQAYSSTDGYGIFNVRVVRLHMKKGSGTNKTAQDLTRRDRKPVLHLARPGDRTQGLRI